jgi:hypothetical protein
MPRLGRDFQVRRQVSSLLVQPGLAGAAHKEMLVPKIQCLHLDAPGRTDCGVPGAQSTPKLAQYPEPDNKSPLVPFNNREQTSSIRKPKKKSLLYTM